MRLGRKDRQGTPQTVTQSTVHRGDNTGAPPPNSAVRANGARRREHQRTGSTICAESASTEDTSVCARATSAGRIVRRIPTPASRAPCADSRSLSRRGGAGGRRVAQHTRWSPTWPCHPNATPCTRALPAALPAPSLSAFSPWMAHCASPKTALLGILVPRFLR